MKLTDVEKSLLAHACDDADGSVVSPATLRGPAGRKLIKRLIGEGLVQEVPTTATLSEWRRNKAKQSLALVITDSGRKALSETAAKRSTQDHKASRDVAVQEPLPSARGKKPNVIAVKGRARGRQARGLQAASQMSKTARLVALLKRPSGAAIKELVTALSWLPHTTRAALTRLRNQGYSLERQRTDSVTSYRITADPPPSGSKAQPKGGGSKRRAAG